MLTVASMVPLRTPWISDMKHRRLNSGRLSTLTRIAGWRWSRMALELPDSNEGQLSVCDFRRCHISGDLMGGWQVRAKSR